MKRSPVALALAFCFLAPAALAQCSSQGLTLTVSGKRLGDPTFVQIIGSPLAPGLLGVDTAAGPSLTTAGTTCLGLSSQLQVIPFTLGADGTLTMGATLPANPWLNGLTLFLHAFAANGTEPAGVLSLSSSNGATLALTSPKLVIIDPGLATTPYTPGGLCIYDALTDLPVTPAIPLPSRVRHAIGIPGAGLVAILMYNNLIQVFDAQTGALVVAISPPTGAAGPGEPKSLATDGSSLFVVYQGAFTIGGFWNSPGSPGAVRSYSLPSGTPVLNMPLPSGNPAELLVVPGSNVGYLRLEEVGTLASPAQPRVLPINLATGATLPVINLGAGYGQILEWIYKNGVVYCLTAGALTSFPPQSPLIQAMSAFSTATNTLLFASPQPLASGGSSLREGPGTGGVAALFLTGTNAAGTESAFQEISPTTLSIINTIPAGGWVADMRLSSGGTEWIYLRTVGFLNPSPGQLPAQRSLATLAQPLLTPTLITNLPSVSAPYALMPLTSASLNKAYLSTSLTSISPFPTDPTSAPTTAVALPVTSQGFFTIFVN